MSSYVTYTLPYEHVVRVGIEAETAEAAQRIAETAFNESVLWDNTPTMPLLMDEYEEIGDAGVPVTFQATPVTEWPGPDNSVLKAQRDQTAHQVARQLVGLYQQARERNEAFISRDRLFDLYQLALAAGAAPSSGCRHEGTPVPAASHDPGPSF
ncbi:MAG: hypothetical protein ACYCVU_10220 [Gammaproteobacteria bacterium]